MDEKSLLFFRKTAELEHITHAAEALYVSPAQLSRVIAEVERELGTPLFDHVGRNIKLNKAGKAFYRYSLRLTALYAEAKGAIAALDDSFEVAFGSNCCTYTVDLLSNLPINKTVTVKESFSPRSSLISMLRDGRIQFAICAPPINDSGIKTDIVLQEVPCVIYPPDHWITGHPLVSLDDLKDEMFVGSPVGYGARDSMDSYYSSRGIKPKFTVESANSPAIEEYVSCGLGVAVVPKSVALHSDYSKTHYADLVERISCPIGFSRIEEGEITNAQQTFMGMVKTYFTEHLGKTLNEHPIPDHE